MSGPAIEYLEIVPGKQHFECDRIHALLSTETCGQRHRIARGERVCGEYNSCFNCPVGSTHAAQLAVVTIDAPMEISPDSRQACIRCGASGGRIMPSLGLCLSCYNRQREYIVGRNAKGKAPVMFRPATDRLAGVVMEGRHIFRMLPGQNQTEPLARVRREGLAMHSNQPGRTIWNSERGAFEYRSVDDMVLLSLEVDGETHFVPVASLRAGEEPARVQALAPSASAGWLSEWLELSGEVRELKEEWRAQPIICEGCGFAPLQARRRAGKAQCRCLACKATS